MASPADVVGWTYRLPAGVDAWCYDAKASLLLLAIIGRQSYFVRLLGFFWVARFMRVAGTYRITFFFFLV